MRTSKARGQQRGGRGGGGCKRRGAPPGGGPPGGRGCWGGAGLAGLVAGELERRVAADHQGVALDVEPVGGVTAAMLHMVLLAVVFGTLALAIGAGHVFVVMLRNAYPINVLERILRCPEVCGIYCATANPLEVLVAKTEQGRGVVGVVDGFPPKGVEKEKDVAMRKEFLRKIGYKL